MRRALGAGICALAFASATACSLVVASDGLSGEGQGEDAGDASIAAEASAESSTTSDALPSEEDAAKNDGGSDAMSACDADGGGDPALVGYWPLDEGTGTTVRDCSGRGHDGLVLNTPADGGWTSGVSGAGFRADGTAGCIDFGAPADLRVEAVAFTVTAWVKVSTFAGASGQTRYAVGHTRTADNAGWRLGGDSTSLFSFQIARGGDAGYVFATSPNGQAQGTWTHLAAIFEPSIHTKLFINGVLVDTRPVDVAAMAVDPISTFRIGCRSDNDRFFDGVIDEVRMYRRALSATEIAALAKP